MDKLNVELFYYRLDRQRKEWNFSWDWVAQQSGVPLVIIKAMAQGEEPTAEEFGKLLHWLYEYGG